MRIISNNKLIKRNQKIGRYTTLASLVVLVGGLIITLSPTTDPTFFLLSFVALVVGFLLSQVGIYYGNRFGRSPRPDELLSSGLKGLDDRYSLYHHITTVSYLLLGPAGIWILNPYSQKGQIMFNANKNRWQQAGGSFIGKLFGGNSLGRPDQDNYALLQDFKKFLAKETPIPALPEPLLVMVFTDPRTSVDSTGSSVPAVTLEKLKDFIRRQAKDYASQYEAVQQLQRILPDDSIE